LHMVDITWLYTDWNIFEGAAESGLFKAVNMVWADIVKVGIKLCNH
jgi:hypothetical protein